nr:hypothetical protein Cplu_318 [Cedratvirus plubellavi]
MATISGTSTGPLIPFTTLFSYLTVELANNLLQRHDSMLLCSNRLVIAFRVKTNLVPSTTLKLLDVHCMQR